MTLSPAYNVPTTLPVGLSSLRVPALNLPPSVAPDPSYAFVLSCGQGPPVTLDGVAVPTSVSTSLRALMQLQPVEVSLCASSVHLSAGAHSVEAETSSNPFAITSLVLQNTPSLFASGYGFTARTASLESWNASTRTIGVGPGATSYLVLPQNYNAAWVATLGTRTLVPVRIDGWQQGYIVPAGPAGTVRLTMGAEASFQLGLLLGAGLLVLSSC